MHTYIGYTCTHQNMITTKASGELVRLRETTDGQDEAQFVARETKSLVERGKVSHVFVYVCVICASERLCSLYKLQ